MKIEEKVIKIVSDQLVLSKRAIKPEHLLHDDLGADSLDTIEIIMAIEAEFDIKIDDYDAGNIACVGDLIQIAMEDRNEN